jgi:hypothetical protein
VKKAYSLILSTMSTDTKPCTNIVDCLNVVNNTVSPGGSATVKAMNSCGVNGPGGGGGDKPKATPFYKTQVFDVILIIV